MPAAYAHITLVNLMDRKRLEEIADFPRAAIAAVQSFLKFCELGAVSPDYPYLVLGDSRAARWADLMHYQRTIEKIRIGVRHLRPIQGAPREKCLAWLLGYAAHVVADVVVHPAVNLKVGPYEENKKDHRVCEMNQDVHLYARLNLGGIGRSEHLRSGIWACRDRDAPDRLDRDIEGLWCMMLQEAHPEEYGNNPPDTTLWHRGFDLVVDKVAEEGYRLFPFARHVAADLGFAYPAEDDLDAQFLKGLRVPTGTQDYDTVIDAALERIGSVWQWIARSALLGEENELARAEEWNLDTGQDQSGRLVFWG
jgi:hypothetical protein